MPQKNVSLVFSGGGARGAYQIGVWKALDELGLTTRVSSVYGTSVGAINGAAFLQNDLERALSIWRSIDYHKVFQDLPPGERLFSGANFAWVRQKLVDRGLNVEPLKNLLRENLSEHEIRKDSRDFGMVVFDLTGKRPRYMRMSDIPDGSLIDFIIASASFPLFKPHKIGDHVYTDGGVYDNRPIRFAASSDTLTDVICVDVTIARHFWKNKKVADNVHVHYIRPSRLLGSPLSFQAKRINDNMELGYHDGWQMLKKMKDQLEEVPYL